MPAKRSTDDAWCILRCSGQKTLRLATTLTEDGFIVWTPIETKRIRIPRKNVRRNITLPIMPSYVFAKAIHLFDLLRLAELAVKPRRKLPSVDEEGKRETLPAHVDFSLMREGEGFPLVSDDSLQALRRLEAKLALTRKSARTFDAGVEITVKIEGGAFAGMRGRVEKSDHGHTLICFGERMTAKIPTSFLDETTVRDELPCSGPPFRKAA